MKTITENRCVLCDKLLEERTPVLVVDMSHALHLGCWREQCLRMTAKQLNEFIKKKLAERSVKQ